MLLQFNTGNRLASLEVVQRDGCVLLDGRPVAVEVLDAAPGRLELRLDGRRRRVWLADTGALTHVCVDGRTFSLVRHTGDEESEDVAAGGPRVTAPLPGKIVKVHVQLGHAVEAGTPLLILEAMKMETEIVAPLAGVVQAVHAIAGATVAMGDPLVDIAPADAPPGV